MSLGENIKNRRMERNLTQEVFAAQIGVGRSMLAQIERGTKVPNMILGREISKQLGCTMEELMEMEQ